MFNAFCLPPVPASFAALFALLMTWPALEAARPAAAAADMSGSKEIMKALGIRGSFRLGV